MATWNESDVKMRLERFTISDSKVAEMVDASVEKYIEEHGIKTGATPEQAAQIESNTESIAVLAETVDDLETRVADIEEQLVVATPEEIDDMINSLM